MEGLADFHDVFANKLDKPTHWVNIEQPVIITRSANVGIIRIKNGGKLIFKDHGPDAIKDGDGHIKLRAVNIKVRDGLLYGIACLSAENGTNRQ